MIEINLYVLICINFKSMILDKMEVVEIYMYYNNSDVKMFKCKIVV